MKVLNKIWTIHVILNTIFVSACYRIYSIIIGNYLTMRMVMKFLCYTLLIALSFLSFSQRGLALVVEKENKKKTSAVNKSEDSSDIADDTIKVQDLVPEGKELINMDFPEPTEIKDIIRAVSLWTGKNIILDRNVSGTVQIISPKKVTKEEAYETFLSALNALDYTVVQTGSVMKVMKKRAALRSNLATYWGNKWAPRTDKVITQIIPLKYVDARKIQLTLQKVVPAQSIVAYEPTNTIIISDSGYQVRRVIEILDQLDVQTQQPKMVMVPIKYSDPKVIQRKVTEILRGTSGRVSQSTYHSFKILTDERWDLKFIGMQIIIEGLALAAFQMLKGLSKDPLLTQLLHYVIRDEARHVTFGINYLEDFIKTLTPEEIEDRAEFAYEACVISRERLINTKAMQKYLKMSEDEAREFALSTSANTTFRNFLFSRIMPNLSRIGLLTDNVRPKFEALGLLEYENAPDDFECDWAELRKPLEDFEKIPV